MAPRCLERSRIQPIPRGKQTCGYFLLTRQYKSIFLGFFEGFFFKDILSRECWSLATVCVRCAELVKLFPYFPGGILQLHWVPGHFSHIPAARCGCSLWMCICLQIGRVIPTEIGKLLQFCQLCPFEGAVYPIPAGKSWLPLGHGTSSL